MQHTVNRRELRSTRRRENISGYLVMAPALLFFFGFVIFPMVMCLVNSTFRYTLAEFTFVGLDNYVALFQDAKFYKSLTNTLVIVLVSVPFTCLFSLWVASLVYKMKEIPTAFFRCVFYLPVVTGSVAVTVVWKWMFNGDFGLINYILGLFGIKGQQWVTNSAIAPYSIIVVTIWGSLGYNMIILLAGIQGISPTYYEAAEIDGAGVVAKFFNITLPLVTPSLFFILITGLIGAFQISDTIFMMIGKNTVVLENTQSVVMYFYRNAFDLGNKGYACAIAMLLFVI